MISPSRIGAVQAVLVAIAVASVGLTGAQAANSSLPLLPDPTTAATMTEAELKGPVTAALQYGHDLLAQVIPGDTPSTDPRNQTVVDEILAEYDDAAIIQLPDGDWLTKATFVPPDANGLTVGDVRTTVPEAGTMVVRFNVTARGAPDAPMPRLLVLRWDEGAGAYKALSSAVFYPVAYALCGPAPAPPENADVPQTDAATLAAQLVGDWYDSLIAANGTSTPTMLHPDAQLQFADGTGYTGVEEYRPAKFGNTTFSNIVAGASGALLAARYEVTIKNQTVDGQPYPDALLPRVTTFLQDEATGEWSVIGHAVYSTPKSTQCGAAGAPGPAPAPAPVPPSGAPALAPSLAGALVAGLVALLA